MKFKPTGNRVLVEPVNDSGHVGLLHVPEAHRDAPGEAVVVALGTGAVNKKGRRTEFEVRVGDRIFMNRFSGQDIEIARKRYKILTSEEILATIE